jgi:dihydrofolate reductase
MRRIRYSVAMSLDGYISAPNGSLDWIIMDPEIDFNTFLDKIDTIFIGRHTYEFAVKQRGTAAMPGMKVYLFSKTLKASDHPDVTVISDNIQEAVIKIRSQSRKNIWLMGGGILFQSLLNLNLVDSIEVTVIPVLLGGGVPFLPSSSTSKKLNLVNSKIYKSGIVTLQYKVD